MRRHALRGWRDRVDPAPKPIADRMGDDLAEMSKTDGLLRPSYGRGHPAEGSKTVKYVALVYNNPGAFEALSERERDELMRDADAYLQEFTESGELLSGGVALADPSTGKTVRIRNGVPAVTDGPFAEAKEQLAGYYVLDCESLERATEIVTHDPAARFWAVEVRPIMDTAGEEM
jgi:hypothetical protein